MLATLPRNIFQHFIQLTNSISESFSVTFCFFFKFLRLRLPLNLSIISSCGIAPSSDIHEPTTHDAWVDSCVRACRNRDTVKPPLEKARSTSVDVAAHRKYIRDCRKIFKDTTNLELTKNPMPCAPMDVQ